VARIELWNGDICDLEVDAIVSPASTSLWMSTGVAGELKRTGGDAIEFAALRLAPANLGDAVVTPAGRLAARVVIHAVSLERDRRTSGPAIDRAARSAMARARELGLASIAFPALGTGIGGFPLDEAASIAVDAVRDELATPSSIEHVIFALRGAAAYEAFARALSEGEPAPTRSLLTPVQWESVGPGLAATPATAATAASPAAPAAPAEAGRDLP
jgi:O-acetyl-ADP-ribose deacetylase (regulator of RNase III)